MSTCPQISSNEYNIIYDGTFEGLLSAVFDIYDRKIKPVSISSNRQTILFGSRLELTKDPVKSERVFNGICKYGKIQTCDMLFHAFLSCAERIEMDIYYYLRFLFHYRRDVSMMMAEGCILRIRQMQRKVTHEAHRMLMFIRFEEAKDGTYFAPISPQYDILRLIISHFKDRFADQSWVIYDTKRAYGAHYNGKDVVLVTISEPTFDKENGKLNSSVVSEREMEYQRLWQTFFKEIAIKERKNLKLQQNFMPKRFWKHLTEKRVQ